MDFEFEVAKDDFVRLHDYDEMEDLFRIYVYLMAAQHSSAQLMFIRFPLFSVVHYSVFLRNYYANDISMLIIVVLNCSLQ